MSTDDKDRMMSLLADRATQGISQEELTELKELLQKFPQWDTSYFDLAATAVDLSDIEIDEPLPEELRQRILANAFQYVRAAQPQHEEIGEPQPINGKEQATTNNREQKGSDNNIVQFPKKSNPWQMAIWYLAAACLVLAVLGWWPRLQSPTTPNLFERRAKFLAEAPDVIKTSWKPTGYKDALTVTGDVVWSNSKQQGFMTFAGMPALDPNMNAYQLWIFDASQDERFPVDGGVFDINQETGEVIVAINAKLKVSQPTLFAITLEKPGGVVVSKRDPLVALAKVN